MERGTSWRTGLALLGLIWLAGGGLLVAPASVDRAIHSVLRDALAPGQQLAARWRISLRDLSRNWRERIGQQNEDPRLAAAEAELSYWRDRAMQLQIEQARRQSEQSDVAAAAAPAAIAAEPLLIARLLPANVLGAEQDALRTRISRVLDRGTLDGVTVDDLVLADSTPHLDQGADAGVAADMAVVSGRSVVGRIRQLGRWTSTVQVVTDVEFRGFARLVRESPRGLVFGAEGVIAGNGDGTCRLDLVSATSPVSVGDFVVTSPRDGSASTTMYFGCVTAAELGDASPHWSITVAPAAAGASFETVQVLLELPNPGRIAAVGAAVESIAPNRGG